MRLSEAKILCGKAISMPSDFRETGLASEQIAAVIESHCPIIEKMSIDEWYIDLRALVGGIPANPREWGWRIQKDIREKTGLSVSVGIAMSKLLAKMAGEYKKPAGITAVGSSGGDAIDLTTFLRDRPAMAIPGIGQRRGEHAAAKEWKTAWDIASAPADIIQKLFGRPGLAMQRELSGEALDPVQKSTAQQQSISRARSFQKTQKRDLLWAYVIEHLQYTTLKMRRLGLTCHGLSIWLRGSTYKYESMHISFPKPQETEEAILPYARRCFASLHREGQWYTQTGIVLWKLAPLAPVQFSLFVPPECTLKNEDLQASLDKLRHRFGRSVITRGSALLAPQHEKPSFGISWYTE